MVTVIGRTLPFAAAIAVSPLPVIVAVLILVSDRARTKSIGYLAGRLGAFVAVVALVALVIGGTATRHAQHGPSTTVSLVRVGFGCALVLIAGRLWFRRGRPGAELPTSRLLHGVDRVTPVRAFALGVALVVIDVGSLVPGIMGGLDIGEARLEPGAAIGAGAVFTAIALASCIVPILAYLIAGSRLDAGLASAKTWLTANDRTVAMVMLFVLGTMMVGRGIEALSTR
ncbi:putative membrane protein [Nocardia nova SH22a]|uniref:Putative membrane protein n=1 Tax=Nocardia nova SH22a TaxID=1415166 RepID=W5TPS2_9NOCA|nr:GAP family protein [Nocardia nova]AHH21267.1 putative membrane protein [Nocardia nova SH22a]